jgi:hypothetical protein
MAFFDFDRRVQTFLIAGALASLTSCGGSVSLDGATDPSDASGDPPLIDVDPLPDVLDPDIVDPTGEGVCPEPATWELDIEEAGGTWPILTLRVSVNVPVEHIGDSSVEFSAEKKRIDAVRLVADNVYEIDYIWEGPVETWGDWDRVTARWNIACYDDAGTHERTLEDSWVVCVMDGTMWLNRDDDPDSCFMVDPPPPPPSEGRGAWMPSTEPPSQGLAGLPPVLRRGALRSSIHAAREADGTLALRVETGGPAAGSATHEWTVSAGSIEQHGDRATWVPPCMPGVHSVQVLSRSGEALCIEVLRIVV